MLTLLLLWRCGLRFTRSQKTKRTFPYLTRVFTVKQKIGVEGAYVLPLKGEKRSTVTRRSAYAVFGLPAFKKRLSFFCACVTIYKRAVSLVFSGCVPAVIMVPTLLGISRPRAALTVPLRLLLWRCGLRFTRSQKIKRTFPYSMHNVF